jgi:hypothetical protein
MIKKVKKKTNKPKANKDKKTGKEGKIKITNAVFYKTSTKKSIKTKTKLTLQSNPLQKFFSNK